MIRKNNKRALYESIMRDVSKTVKNLNEDTNNIYDLQQFIENSTFPFDEHRKNTSVKIKTLIFNNVEDYINKALQLNNLCNQLISGDIIIYYNKYKIIINKNNKKFNIYETNHSDYNNDGIIQIHCKDKNALNKIEKILDKYRNIDYNVYNDYDDYVNSNLLFLFLSLDNNINDLKKILTNIIKIQKDVIFDYDEYDKEDWDD